MVAGAGHRTVPRDRPAPGGGLVTVTETDVPSGGVPSGQVEAYLHEPDGA